MRAGRLAACPYAAILSIASGIVRGQRHLDRLVDVEPFGVMVQLLGDKRGARHEAEGLVEIREYEGLGDGVAAFHLAPAGELCECGLAGIRAELLSHAPILI